jgi:hypothetical protein
MSRPPSALLVLVLAACAGPVVGPAPGPDDPISAVPELWSWVGFPDSVCGDGTPTGVGVNPTARSTDVVIYLQGGGACWDGWSCLGMGLAANVSTGYGVDQFVREPALGAPAFDRANPQTPWRDASWVFVPYCTGDLHAGDAVRSYLWQTSSITVHHAGRTNLASYLRRLAPTFPGARRVYLVGSSAGGYGVQLDYESVSAAFPAAEVHLLADGAQLVPPGDHPAYPPPGGDLWTAWRSSWNLSLPAGCAGCGAQPGALASWLSAAHPARRFALLASTQDQVLAYFLGYLPPADLDAPTRALLADRYDPSANARYFALASTQHTMLGNLSTTSAAGVPLSAWLGRWYAGDPAWASTGP